MLFCASQMSAYDFARIEASWQRRWDEARVFEVSDADARAAAADPAGRRTFSCIEMLPYPSGKLHSGHVRNYSIGDAVAHFQRMHGRLVLHPIGWDALGLPAENAAIERGADPRTWTLANIAEMKRQLRRLGISYAWEREIATCDPAYYRWNQWFFLRLLERDLVYRSRRILNWCPRCATVLANEQVEEGRCWRHDDTVVEQREMDQWFVRVTRMAADLDACLDRMPGWPEAVRTMQHHWIGRSEGARIRFPVLEAPAGAAREIEVFTTRLDTIFGATFLVLSPEHPMTRTLSAGTPQEAAVRAYAEAERAAAARDRFGTERGKEGVFTGRHARNPYTGEPVPIWTSGYVLMDYGSGAIMAVPGHDARDFEFATQHDLPVVRVIRPPDDEPPEPPLPWTGNETDVLVASGKWSGMRSPEAIASMAAHAREAGFGEAAVTWRLRDWGISRQRRWGTPIPIVYCAACGTVPVPDDRLPVLLPEGVNLAGIPGAPLAAVPSFVETTCPKCGGPARRETDTMDTFVDSSWYFYRYTDPKNEKAPFDPASAAPWFPIDLYIGGIAHATGHLIYCRFFHKFMRELGLTRGDEPVRNLLTQGMVVSWSTFCPEHRWISPEEIRGGGGDGAPGHCPHCGRELTRTLEKMSKSKNNAPDLDRMIDRYGADTVRMYLLFAAPPESEFLWSETGIEGCARLLGRVHRFQERHGDALRAAGPPRSADGDAGALRRKTHRTIAAVTDDIGRRMLFNTAVARIFELVNALYGFYDREPLSGDEASAAREALVALSGLMVPFTPHLAEEMHSRLGLPGLGVSVRWPVADAALLSVQEVQIVVQVGGKLRARLSVPADADEAAVLGAARGDEKVAAALAGRAVARTVYVPGRLLNIVPQ